MRGLDRRRNLKTPLKPIPDTVYRVPFFTTELERFDVIRWTGRELVAMSERGDICRFTPKEFSEFHADPIHALKLGIRFLEWKKIDPARLARFKRELSRLRGLH